MLEIANCQVHGLEASMARSGMPHRTGRPDIEEMRYGSAKRARTLGRVKSGEGHDCYLKGIIVQFDLKYSGYFTPQLQRYSWVNIISSQSKMVKLKKVDLRKALNKYVDPYMLRRIEELQQDYRDNPTYENRMVLLSSLPSGFEQWMSISTNYLQLKTIHNQRRSHRLKEDWGYMCDWIEALPMFMELTQREG